VGLCEAINAATEEGGAVGALAAALDVLLCSGYTFKSGELSRA
jgi:hypothetical protein